MSYSEIHLICRLAGSLRASFEVLGRISVLVQPVQKNKNKATRYYASDYNRVSPFSDANSLDQTVNGRESTLKEWY